MQRNDSALNDSALKQFYQAMPSDLKKPFLSYFDLKTLSSLSQVTKFARHVAFEELFKRSEFILMFTSFREKLAADIVKKESALQSIKEWREREKVRNTATIGMGLMLSFVGTTAPIVLKAGKYLELDHTQRGKSRDIRSEIDALKKHDETMQKLWDEFKEPRPQKKGECVIL